MGSIPLLLYIDPGETETYGQATLPPCSSHACRAPRLLRPPRALRRRLPAPAKPSRILAPQASSRSCRAWKVPNFRAFRRGRAQGGGTSGFFGAAARSRHDADAPRGVCASRSCERGAASTRSPATAPPAPRVRVRVLVGRWGLAAVVTGIHCNLYSFSAHCTTAAHGHPHAHLRTLAHARRERALPVTTLVPRVGKA